jgi:hypothetical protein
MLAIIGKNDKVLFSMALKNTEVTYTQQFQIHASLDLIEKQAQNTSE